MTNPSAQTMLAGHLETYGSAYRTEWKTATPCLSWGEFDLVVAALRAASAPAAAAVRAALGPFLHVAKVMEFYTPESMPDMTFPRPECESKYADEPRCVTLTVADFAALATPEGDPCPYCKQEMRGAEDCPKCGCGSPARSTRRVAAPEEAFTASTSAFRCEIIAPGGGERRGLGGVAMNEREELLALAAEYEAGTAKAVASGYEEFGPDFQRKRKLIIDALRGVAQGPTDCGKLRQAIRDIIKSNNDFMANLPEDWEGDPLQDAIHEAAKLLLAPARQAASHPDGWVLVPKEPTDKMCEAMLGRIEDAEAGRGAPFKWPDIEHMFDVYTDAIAAAPSVSSSQRLCAKCRCETKGEEALVNGEIWCHPCADNADTLRNALKPFAAVAESDIGQDETDADIFQPMRSGYNREPLITVGDMCRAALALSSTDGKSP